MAEKFRLSFLTILAFLSIVLFYGSCSNQLDGPLETNAGRGLQGQGFYLKAELDSGNFWHPIGDSLSIHLDSLFLMNECAIEKFHPVSSIVDDTLLSLNFKIDLVEPSGIHCAELGVDFDSVYKVDFANEWSSVKSMVVYCNEVSRVVQGEDTVLQVIPGQYVACDTIQLRKGEYEEYSGSFLIDSLKYSQRDKHYLQRDASHYLFRQVLDTIPLNQTLSMNHYDCLESISTCKSVLDTIILFESSIIGDTLDAAIRKKCLSLDTIYCPSREWRFDSTIATTFMPSYDTLWPQNYVIVSEGSTCSPFQSMDVSYFSNNFVPDSISYKGRVFNMESSQRECANKQESWMVFDLQGDSVISDVIWRDSIVSVLKKIR